MIKKSKSNSKKQGNSVKFENDVETFDIETIKVNNFVDQRQKTYDPNSILNEGEPKLSISTSAQSKGQKLGTRHRRKYQSIGNTQK